jgi:predicted Fe-S protein YdhL (DUF1289 family)
MRSGRTLGALALALTIGLAAPCVRAQHHGGGGGASHSAPPPAHASAPHTSNPHPNYHPYQNRAANGRPPASYRAPAHNVPPQTATAARPQTLPNNPNAYRAPQSTIGPAPAPQGAGNGRSVGNLPPKWAENLKDRSPEEQQHFMQNNERFRSLPPDRQQQIRQNLQKWNSLSPTERNAIRDRQETWGRMSPDQKQYVQRTLLPKWQAMSPDRKQLVTGRLHTLQQMSPSDRQAALTDPRFMQGLSPDEQSVLRGLDSVRNP